MHNTPATQNHENQVPNGPTETGITFCLVHGSWHGAWCWKFLQQEIENLGHKSIAMDLPINNPEARFVDLAEIVSESITDEKNTVVVAHSRQANIVPLVASELAVRQAVYLCAGFEANNDFGHKGPTEKLPIKHSDEFIAGIRLYAQNMNLYYYDPELAAEMFYHDCPTDIAEWAVSQLRPGARPEKEQPIKFWPEVPSLSISTNGDRIINPEYSACLARKLGARAIQLEGSHSPFLSRPRELALKLTENLAQLKDM